MHHHHQSPQAVRSELITYEPCVLSEHINAAVTAMGETQSGKNPGTFSGGDESSVRKADGFQLLHRLPEELLQAVLERLDRPSWRSLSLVSHWGFAVSVRRRGMKGRGANGGDEKDKEAFRKWRWRKQREKAK